MREDMERIERRISAVVCIAMCVIGIAVQIATTLLLTAYLRDKAGYVYLILQLLAFICSIFIYQRPGSPSFRLAWICLLIASPVAGMILFLLWGGIKQAKNLSLKKIPPMTPDEIEQKQCEQNLKILRDISPAWGRLAAYLIKRDNLLYTRTKARYFPDGSAFFQDLIQNLNQARRYIFLEYFILAEGEIWDKIFQILKQRAAAGVGVYIIFDDFGNLFRFSGKSLQAVQDAGIHVGTFNPVHHSIPRAYFNYRDHRKIAVIDGVTAYTGGINLADEYANLIERYGHWKDTGIRIDGDGAWGFAAMFIRMWKRLGRAFPHPDSYYRACPENNNPPVTACAVTPPFGKGGENGIEIKSLPCQRGVARETRWGDSNSNGEISGFCQPFSDGPRRRPDHPIEEIYLQLISSAQRVLYITTPYYAVEDAMQEALCIAADAGVDVRLCVPAIPDHKLVYLAGETYWGELLKHGVRIYRYTPGFLHAKSVLADREAALIGTTNMDYRTFQLHYECGVLLYHMPVIENLYQDFMNLFQTGQEYTLEDWRDWKKRPLSRRIIGMLIKLGAIWL